MKEPILKLRFATRRAKSDVANKLISMFLHELSRKLSQGWTIKVDSEEYANIVREHFGNQCPYCSCEMTLTDSVIEHLDGMNRYRAGLHVPGNVLVACKRCNSEKRRDDALKALTLAEYGWESFLSHDGTHCGASCATCRYWAGIWTDPEERRVRLRENLERVHSFRGLFSEFQQILPSLTATHTALLSKLYSDCQAFAETEIKTLLGQIDPAPYGGKSSE